MNKKFIDLYMADEIEQNKVYDYIEDWRQEHNTSLADFLGLTDLEFIAFLESANNLSYIKDHREFIYWLTQCKSGQSTLKFAEENKTDINDIIFNIQQQYKTFLCPLKPENYLYYYKLILTAVQSNYISENPSEITVIKANGVVISAYTFEGKTYIESYFAMEDGLSVLNAPEEISTPSKEFLQEQMNRENYNDKL